MAPNANAVGRPSKPLLSRALIADAALRLIDREGSDALAMRRIARELGVDPSSLYNHIDSKSDLIEELRGVVSARIDASAFVTEPWSEAVITWAHSYRSAFSSHPRLIPLLMSKASTSPVIMGVYEEFALAAGRDGWADSDILPILTALESFVLGSVLDMSGPTVLFDPRGQEDEFPAFSRAFHTLQEADPDDPVAGPAFELGLRGLVRGLTELRRR
ncbi:transcriptional regulator, TetR family [Agreia bicolorata]|uniref:Transcriptional regulator, TetR family n=1 Tax=Agreia bicolorata TaxID=110935 RepID=A0A1T4Y412_9MICO|nr:TetR/AcrR family transcriptional regulator [Agreia bicolorata]SKA96476.1 transcriptional regulator, TetR family [Agreia bicolorata]